MVWRILLAGCLIFALAPAQAVETFPRSQLQNEQKETMVDYRVVLSGLKRTQAVTYGEQERRVSGDLWRRVWSLPEHVPLAEVTDFYRAQLARLEVLYQCRALDCGSSNFWANEIFANYRLVGREQNQFYSVALDKGNDGINTLYVLYIVQRGTRQIMVNLDIVSTRDAIEFEASMEDRVKLALEGSSGWLPGLVAPANTLDEKQSEPLLTVLKGLTPGLKQRLFLVVQCYDAARMQDNIECSEKLAQQLRQVTDDGSHPLDVRGHGALTPAADGEIKPALRFVFWPGR